MGHVQTSAWYWKMIFLYASSATRWSKCGFHCDPMTVQYSPRSIPKVQAAARRFPVPATGSGLQSAFVLALHHLCTSHVTEFLTLKFCQKQPHSSKTSIPKRMLPYFTCPLIRDSNRTEGLRIWRSFHHLAISGTGELGNPHQPTTLKGDVLCNITQALGKLNMTCSV